MQSINTTEFNNLQIPLPPLEIQHQLVVAMQTARQQRNAQLAEANALLASLSDFVLEQLGLVLPTPQDHLTYAVRMQDMIAAQRFDVDFHNPNFQYLMKSIAMKQYDILGNLVTFSTETWNPKTAEQETFQYIEISGVNIVTGEYQIDEISTSEAPSRARMVVRANDILVSTTRPQRGAIMMVTADHDGAIASTGFAIIRTIRDEVILREYLLYALRTQACLQQMLQRSSGGNYPAITQDELAKIIIPLPPLDIQQTIVNELNQRRAEARRLREEADRLWQTAQRQFEQALLGKTEESSHQ